MLDVAWQNLRQYVLIF